MPNGRNAKIDPEAPVQLYDPHYDSKKVHVGLRRNQTPIAEDGPKELDVGENEPRPLQWIGEERRLNFDPLSLYPEYCPSLEIDEHRRGWKSVARIRKHDPQKGGLSSV